MNAGKRVRIARKQRSLTQAELAKKLSLTQTAVAKIEGGIRKPSFRVALRLIDLFGQDIFLPKSRKKGKHE